MYLFRWILFILTVQQNHIGTSDQRPKEYAANPKMVAFQLGPFGTNCQLFATLSSSVAAALPLLVQCY